MFALIVRHSLQSRALVLLAALGMLAYGAWLFARTPVDVLPDPTRPTVTIVTETAGLAPEEVERPHHRERAARRHRRHHGALHLRHRLRHRQRRVWLE